MTKNFSSNVQQKRVGAVPRPTGNGIKKHKATKATNKAWSPISKAPSKKRAASPTPMRIHFEVPLRDEIHPHACFKQPFVTVRMAMKRVDPAFKEFKDRMRTENLVRAFDKLKTSEPTPTPMIAAAVQQEQQIQYTRVKNERAYICSACNAKVGEGSALYTHAELVHRQASWTRPGLPGRPTQDVHCDKYRQQLAAEQGLKWHQQPVLTNAGQQYYSVYHPNAPYEYCKRRLANGETATVKYRRFSESYGDLMRADPECPEDQGMDQAIRVHEARFSYSGEDIIRFAIKEFEQVPHVSMRNPIFQLDKLEPLTDPCNKDGNEETNEEDLSRAKGWLDGWLTEAILNPKDVQTAEDLPSFQEEVTSFPNEVIVDQSDIPESDGYLAESDKEMN